MRERLEGLRIEYIRPGQRLGRLSKQISLVSAKGSPVWIAKNRAHGRKVRGRFWASHQKAQTTKA